MGAGELNDLMQAKTDLDRYGAEFGRRLRRARELRGVSRARLAALTCGVVNEIAIRRWEAGALPSVAKAAVMADVLQCSVDWLVGRVGPSVRGAGA